MTKKEEAVLECGELAVILGDGAAARISALLLRTLGGIKTLICDTKKSCWRAVLPFGVFYALTRSDDSNILLAQLLDLSSSAERSLLFLTAKRERYVKALKNISPELESRFILSDIKGILLG